jgi:hypothetical protein
MMILGLDADGRRLRASRMRNLQRLEDAGVEWVAVVDSEMQSVFRAAAVRLVAEMPRGKRSMTILVSRREPPKHGARIDGNASSFICSASVFQSLMRQESLTDHSRLTFAVLFAVMNNKIAVDHIAIRQLPLDEAIQSAAAAERRRIALIMAHRGKVRHLGCALSYIGKAACPKMTVRIGLDVDKVDAYRKLVARYPEVQFFRVTSPATGPYVIRQLLASRSRAPLIAFHDSDDVSCFDRFTALTREMAATDCDLIGCHELRVHELDREVTVMRFPLDVSGSLRGGPEHSMLHPSSMIRRKAFFEAGGFSTDRVFSNDTQFLLRACFNINIRNVDGFYYIRRKHADALTVAPATCLEHPVRAELLRRWHKDFAEVRQGRMLLGDSSLRAIPAERKHHLIRVSSSEASRA